MCIRDRCDGSGNRGRQGTDWTDLWKRIFEHIGYGTDACGNGRDYPAVYGKVGERLGKNGGKTDYSRLTSRQIAVYKTDKALLELVDSLKPAGTAYPAHIHASGEEDEEGYSLIRLQMVDYSAGTGQKSVSVYANISPDEALYLYSRVFSGVQTFSMFRQKIFGEVKKEGNIKKEEYANVTKLMVSRYETDSAGKKRAYPWSVQIQNGIGIKGKNSNGGTYCKKDSFVSDGAAEIFLTDADMFHMFSRAEAWIRAFEREQTGRKQRKENFGSLYRLLNKELEGHFAGLYQRFEEMGLLEPDEKAA